MADAALPPLLRRNLDALAPLDNGLVQRICLPIDSSHLELPNEGPAYYKLGLSKHTFILSQLELDTSLAALQLEHPGRKADNLFLFGIGLGEQLAFLLKRCPHAAVTVWDRDPALVRAALSRHDFSPAISAGRLRLTMGADLLDQLRKKKYSTVFHPFLKLLYRNENLLLAEGAGERRALICAGGLFVDDVADALRKAGYSLFTFELQRQAMAELQRVAQRFAPEFIVAVNYVQGLAEFCQRHDYPLLCWEIDPATDNLRPLTAGAEQAHIFTYRKEHVREFKAAGFQQAEYLPLAANVERRGPMMLVASERARYECPVSFVGLSMAHQIAPCRERFLTAFTAYRGGAPDARQEGQRLLDEVLAEQRKDFSAHRLPELFRRYNPDFAATFGKPGVDPLKLAGEIAAAEKRAACVSALGRFQIRVWGDDGWLGTERSGVRYMGLAHHDAEVTRIYSGSAINLDVNRLYQSDIVTMRVFDILACGGFLLTEDSAALRELFKPGVDLDTYATPEELCDKVSFYLEHAQAARTIARQGMETVRRRHTIEKRVHYMLGKLSGEEPGTEVSAQAPQAAEALRLHIGGQVGRPGWKLLNIQPAPCVDFVGDCTDLSRFADNSIDEIYASHVYEHLSYQTQLAPALKGVQRVLKPGGVFKVSVPDLELLCKMFIDPALTPEQRFRVMRMIYGGQVDPYDFHYVGLSFEFLQGFLVTAGFSSCTRVAEFGLFDDTSSFRFMNQLISLNVEATK